MWIALILAPTFAIRRGVGKHTVVWTEYAIIVFVVNIVLAMEIAQRLTERLGNMNYCSGCCTLTQP